MRPQRNAAIGAQRQQAIVLINQINAITFNDEIIHRTQFTFPHDLAAAQIQRREVAVISQRIHHVVDNDRSGINIAQAVDFSRTCSLRNTLLPNHLALLHQYGAHAAVVTAHDCCTKSRSRSRFTAQRK
ncbi:hypothetical protein D3C86_1828850 [compost metagenome]